MEEEQKSQPRFSPRSVLRLRMLLATTGVTTAISGGYLAVLTILRFINGPAPVRPAGTPQSLGPATIIFSITFVVGYLLQGFCWALLAVNNYFWHGRDA